MSKKYKILLILLIISVFLLFYIVLTSESFKEKIDNSIGDISGKFVVTKEKIAVDYKVDASRILSDYSRLIEKKEITASEIQSIKNRLLNLTVPAEFKDLHVNLILALTKMGDYSASKDEAEKSESERLISQAKEDFAWLNKK